MSTVPLFAGLAFCCAANAQQFDVASIKPAPPQPPGQTSTQMDVTTDATRNGILRYSNVTLKEVLGEAYQVKQYQIAGGPGWLDSERFDITATIPAGARREVPKMLQTLAAERFGLSLHRETRELPVYVLQVGKNGSKLKPAKSATGISRDTDGTHSHLTAETTMAAFVDSLSQRLDRPVLDETGLTGAFEITLDWASDSGGDPVGPSIFTAVQEQLGLKLESRRSGVEILVIDHADKPSEN